MGTDQLNSILVERAIQALVDEFSTSPYRFFTEADAVARFHSLLMDFQEFAQTVASSDGHEIPVVHREFPTFFRFSDKSPRRRLGPPASRGHYDTVILRPEFVAANPAEVVTNRSIGLSIGSDPPHLFAAIEFKLDRQGWSRGRAGGAIAELGKLRLSEAEVMHRYFVILMRYTATSDRRWRKYWPQVSNEIQGFGEIPTVVAVSGQSYDGAEGVYPFGDWSINWESR